MYEGRDLGGTPDLDAHTVAYYDFARFDFPSPVGTIRYTNRPGGYIGNIGDGSGSATWSEWDLRFEDISNSPQTALEVTSIQLANLNNVWSEIVLNHGIDMVPILLMQVWFDPPTITEAPNSGTITGKPKFFTGRMELARIKDGLCDISLIPHRSGMSQMIPARTIGPTCGLPYGDPRTCQYPGPFTAPYDKCDHSRKACEERNNISHFGGEDLVPKEKIVWKIISG